MENGCGFPRILPRTDLLTKDFSFGAAIFEDDPLEELCAILDQWNKQFAADGFAADVSSRGTKAWAVSHDAAIRDADLLVERLRNIISELASL